MPNLDWGKLYAQGRCKAPFVSFSEDELKAVFTLKIPVDYVRDGIITLVDYEKALEKEAKTGIKPMSRMDRADLLKIAKDLGINFTPDVTKDVLVSEINKRNNQKEQQAESRANVKEAYDTEEQFQADQDARAKVMKDEAVEKIKADTAETTTPAEETQVSDVQPVEPVVGKAKGGRAKTRKGK